MAYKTFANGFPLPASDLNNYLMNQSVIVFANSTARSAALPTPTEGMITYLEDTNAVEVWDASAWQNINDNSNSVPLSTVAANGDLIVADGASSVTRLGVGTADQVLTTDGTDVSWSSPSYVPAVGTDDQVLTVVSGEPAWADAGGGGNYTLISDLTLSSSGFSITSIPQIYKDLYLQLDLDGFISLILNGYSSSYIHSRLTTSSNSISNRNDSALSSLFNRGQIAFLDYSNTSNKLFYQGMGIDTLNDIGRFYFGLNGNGPAAISSISTSTSRSGNVKLYGKVY